MSKVLPFAAYRPNKDVVSEVAALPYDVYKRAEAKAFAASLNTDAHDSGLSVIAEYPVVYFNSDTTGEKAYEEFYVPGEKIDMERFKTLGVVEQTSRHDLNEVNSFFNKLESIFKNDEFTKAQVVDAIMEFLPNFEHVEKGKNLDQKM